MENATKKEKRAGESQKKKMINGLRQRGLMGGKKQCKVSLLGPLKFSKRLGGGEGSKGKRICGLAGSPGEEKRKKQL